MQGKMQESYHPFRSQKAKETYLAYSWPLLVLVIGLVIVLNTVMDRE